MITFLIAVGLAIIAAVLGLAALSPLPVVERRRWLPVAPLVGVALIAVVSSSTAPLLPMGLAWPIPIVVASIALVLGWRRHGPPWRGLRRGVSSAVIATAVGGFAVLLALGPSLVGGYAGLVQPSDNNDAFYFVSVAEWLRLHSSTVAPLVASPAPPGSDPIAFGPAAETYGLHLRIGAESVLAWFSTVTGADVVDLFTSATALWVGLLAGPSFVIARAFVGRRWAAAVVAVPASMSAVVITQAFAQNTASLLGEALALLVTAALVIGPRFLRLGRPALGVGGLALAGLVTVYPETFPVFVPLWAALAVLRGRAVLGGALGVVGIAIVLAPASWWRAAGEFAMLATISTDGERSPSIATGMLGPLGRLPEFAPPGGAATLVDVFLAGIAVCALAGVAVSISVRRSRAFGIGVAGAIAMCVVLGSGATEYTFHRAVDMLWPVLLLAVGVGLRRLPTRGLRALAAAAGASYLLANLAIAGAVSLQRWDERVVDDSYRAAVAEAMSASGEDGAQILVATGDLFQQLWLSYEFRDEPAVSYATIRGDLGYRDDPAMSDGWDGARDRILVVGADVAVDFEPQAVIGRVGDFVVLDASRGDVLLALPAAPLTDWAPNGDIAACDAHLRVLAWGASAERGTVTITDSAGTERVLAVPEAFVSDVPLGGSDSDDCRVQLDRTSLG